MAPVGEKDALKSEHLPHPTMIMFAFFHPQQISRCFFYRVRAEYPVTAIFYYVPMISYLPRDVGFLAVVFLICIIHTQPELIY